MHGRSVIVMGNSFNSSGDYRIEISGWGLDNSFFVERTDLQWAANGDKQVQLHRALSEGAVVFVRLLASAPNGGSLPVAYRVEEIVPMDRSGRCQLRLTQLHPRGKSAVAGESAAKESSGRNNASNAIEVQRKVCDVLEEGARLQYEEVLQ
jgi:hypothetical protein